ncbi:hypothetical protein QYQ99_03650 [Comamonas testosteroni]|uniref:hypothetical protein n=1 Tax=Comamonas testosteroni TaxID=285 RepID=UPI00265E8F8C|nr:hypothetical protein [Comamonas testosteroni]WKL16662.1 hypothetical protein QYQ99_03650 [Comamonas testosteroni]
MDTVIENREWVFSGIGILVLTALWKIFGNMVKTLFGIKLSNNDENHPAPVSINNTVNVHNMDNGSPSKTDEVVKSLDSIKQHKRILFIDDDTKFKVVKILYNSGWIFTKHVKDAKSLIDREILEADIIFIDIQGVGAALGFKDEGLGLALALKDKYPEKKIVIYSVIEDGNRFHDALRKADSFLSKNADPYEFEKTVEELLLGK